MFQPVGVLAEVPLAVRLGAFALALVVYAGVGYRLFVGIVVGEVLLLAGWMLL